MTNGSSSTSANLETASRDASTARHDSSSESRLHALVSDLSSDSVELLRSALPRENIAVTVADVFDALFGDEEPPYEILILGQNLMHIRELRSAGIQLPILALLPDTIAQGRVQALEAGVDDCLGTPFAISELVARIRSLNRRTGNEFKNKKNGTKVDSLVVSIQTLCATREDQRVSLTPTEAMLLELLMENCGRVLSIYQIATSLWGCHSDVSSNLVAAHMKNLRQKLACLQIWPIRTLRGRGYLMTQAIDFPVVE